MLTVKSIMEQMTNPSCVLQKVYETLRELDPVFPAEKAKYTASVQATLEVCTGFAAPSTREYIDAVECEIAAELVYAAWLGFQLNMDCFQNPVNALALKGDYEDIHRERRMHTLPLVSKANQTMNAFYEQLRKLPEEARSVTDGITDFICYLETKGFKLAHYFGFLLADSFLYHVVPGYTKDSVTTGRYAWSLEEYMQLSLKRLEGN